MIGRLAAPALALALVLLPTTSAAEEGVGSWVKRLEGVEARATPDGIALVDLPAPPSLADDLAGSIPPDSFYRDPLALLRSDPLHLRLVRAEEFDLPVAVNGAVAKWVKYFTGRGRSSYARWMSRSTKYRPMMYAELEAKGLPADLVYLSMIESGYNATARSHAGATGLWQFMTATGRGYDLQIDEWIDERRDAAKSTVAAVRYLGELHRMFDDWYLAFAAYNTGPSRVRRATERAGSRDYWVLRAGPYLHSETDEYVPKILAAAIIGKHPERYGFEEIRFQPELTYDEVVVDEAVELSVLAECAGIELDRFKELNPALISWALPPEGAALRLPVGAAEAFTKALSAVPADRRIRRIEHVVKRGETLSGIASRYGVPAGTIVSANGLRNPNRIGVGSTLVIPSGPGATPAAAAAATATSPRAEQTITVKAGDTLSEIAEAHGTTTQALQERNKITDPSSVRVGQELVVPAGGATSPAPPKTHTVGAGDTLSVIAERYGCTVSQLKAWNGLSSSVIHPGQELVVSGS